MRHILRFLISGILAALLLAGCALENYADPSSMPAPTPPEHAVFSVSIGQYTYATAPTGDEKWLTALTQNDLVVVIMGDVKTKDTTGAPICRTTIDPKKHPLNLNEQVACESNGNGATIYLPPGWH